MSVYDYFPFLKRPAPKFVTESGAEVYGVMAEFRTPAEVYHAAEKVRDAGYSKWDVYAPFPIHGIEEAMGMKRTILPVFVAIGAFSGTGLAYLMQWWMNHDFPLSVQGKPPWAWEPFTPIVFELSILLSAFTALGSMLALNGLPRWHHPLFAKDRFLRCSQDRFCIAIEAADGKFNPQSTRNLLQSTGAHAVELVEE